MDYELTGRRALVTGSTKGIGYAIAEALAAEGAAVTINGRTDSSCAAAAKRLRAAQPAAPIDAIAADVADPQGVRALIEQAGEVDILVNAAGLFDLVDFTAADDDVWQGYLDVNLMSAVRLSRALLPAMLERGWGRIVSIASESGVNVPADMIPYGVSKAGLIALGNGLAKLTRGTAVTVNTILGGPTYSDGVADVVEQIAAAQGAPIDAVKAAIAARNTTSLVERFLEPAEIAHLAAYLSSPLASATNGSAIRADGGVLTAML